MLENIKKQSAEKMEKAIQVLKKDLASMRAGRATPALLEKVTVSYYGSEMPVNQLASISAPEPRLLVVQPWDKSALAEIERAILKSELGLTPTNDGNVIRIPIPPLSEERRKDMVRLLHKMAEEGRISVRHARQEANKEIKQRQQDHEISEDEAHRQLEEVQRITDEYVARIDELMDAKEAEVMEV